MNLINLISKAIDHAIKVIGNAVSWLTLIMTVITFLIVILRYVFNIGSIWMQESLVWMHSAIFLLGAAYTLKLDEHVRVDIFYRSFSPKQKSWVNIIGAIFFALPVCIFFLVGKRNFQRCWRPSISSYSTFEKHVINYAITHYFPNHIDIM